MPPTTGTPAQSKMMTSSVGPRPKKPPGMVASSLVASSGTHHHVDHDAGAAQTDDGNDRQLERAQADDAEQHDNSPLLILALAEQEKDDDERAADQDKRPDAREQHPRHVTLPFVVPNAPNRVDRISRGRIIIPSATRPPEDERAQRGQRHQAA